MRYSRLWALWALGTAVLVDRAAAQPPTAIRPPTLGMPVPKPTAKRVRPAPGKNELAAGVEGDLYLVTPVGETLRGAGQHVVLMLDEPSLRDSVAEFCRRYDSTATEIGKRYVASRGTFDPGGGSTQRFIGAVEAQEDARSATESNWRVLFRRARSLYEGARVDEVKTGVEGRYRLDNLRPGTYLLFAEWTV